MILRSIRRLKAADDYRAIATALSIINHFIEDDEPIVGKL